MVAPLVVRRHTLLLALWCRVQVMLAGIEVGLVGVVFARREGIRLNWLNRAFFALETEAY